MAYAPTTQLLSDSVAALQIAFYNFTSSTFGLDDFP